MQTVHKHKLSALMSIKALCTHNQCDMRWFANCTNEAVLRKITLSFIHAVNKYNLHGEAHTQRMHLFNSRGRQYLA